ncbi:Adenine specific DNA methyltransferase [Methylorubrum extorquens]|uniref:site-specific DNA-methyltransferase (adenine-specific) n=1 Tax=Methylorubrum extorquens TaxID=408 RepID=A0A2N9AWQ2_METEX|nr:Adenine specific DNA methyltransferase [Methylorubrum extorquens]
MKIVENYINDVQRKFLKGNATEHTYRASLVALSDEMLPNNFVLTNEPKRQKCGAPDYILESKDVPVGYIEAKDIGVSLDKVEKSDQMDRYLNSLDNLILTDYLEFRFFRRGKKIGAVKLASVKGGRIQAEKSAFGAFADYYKDFSSYKTQSITSPKALAEIMARKASLVKDVFANILSDDTPSGLNDQYDAFRQILLHTVTKEEFADIYAETLAYGLFTARLHDTTPDTFSREEAYRLIPHSNPFLKELFTYVGTKLDSRAEWIVDELCDVFRATDVQKMLSSFNRGTGRDDPFLHFYETFLGQYNPEKKKSRGVWYTPEPVVKFIVRAIDDVLINDFGLKNGLGNTETTKIKVEAQGGSKRSRSSSTVKVDKIVHKVQILDVATGTGTFLSEVILQIYQKFKSQQGTWSKYVEDQLIPRLHGFELLMASYSMCHMKLELLLQETGYKPKAAIQPRLNVYLTNSLQKYDDELDKLPLIEWFSRESNEASYIKKYSPIMVAIGNPPYSGLSSNMDELLVDIEEYKFVDGIHFGEKKHWLHDDYVKFIRLGEFYIEKNGEGILGYITNHSYLDNPTFRGMRWHLLKTFDVIRVIDLHGNAKKLERSPDGTPDKNVFDIQQGVSIIIATKKKGKSSSKLASVYHSELWGSRESKYEFLNETRIADVEWLELAPQKPFYFFVPKDMQGSQQYGKGFALDDLFRLYGVGIVTARDKFVVDIEGAKLLKRMREAAKLPTEDARQEYGLRKDVDSWKVSLAQEELRRTGPSSANVLQIDYRPFDTRNIYYTERSNGILARPNHKIMKHFIGVDNVGMMVSKQQKASGFTHVLAHKKILESSFVSNRTSEIGYTFPLYLYENNGLAQTKEPNFHSGVWGKIVKIVGSFAENPIHVYDYVYAVLHANSYRIGYAEFLKSNFPRVPFPKNKEYFRKLAEKGGLLRRLHLLEGLEDFQSNIASFPVDGDDIVSRWDYHEEKMWINSTQYFDKVPPEAASFVIGAYEPATKWLKDRRGVALSLADIQHYQSLIYVLAETAELMIEIDELFLS